MTDPLDRLKAALAERYAIERELGSGGMATVYLAEDVKHHRKVAVKVLKPDLAAVLGAERFLREIEIAAQLHHPHILPLYDSGESEGFLYYVMPYEEGQSLREKLAREGELPVTHAVRIVRDVADALAHAHGQGVVHRDIKPDNVLLSGRHALVTDFGVAKAVSEATGRQQLTTAGVALGTPAYMAPEQAVADPHIDHRADIYAVGALAYELLTGRPPFTGTTPQMVLAAHVTDTPDPVTKHRDTVSGALEQVVMRCLEKKPADRWQSAEDLVPQLEALTTPSVGITPTDTRPLTAEIARPRARWGTVGALAGGMVLALGAIWMLANRSSEDLASASERGRIAVLQFANLSASEEDEYFADGIAQDINIKLQKIGDFGVIAHGSSRQYSSGETSYGDIAMALGADYLVDGSVRRAGDRLRVTVSLIDPSTSEQLWADEYSRALSVADIFAVQSDVAQQVAMALGATFAPEQATSDAQPTGNLEAYNAYLLGRFHWNKRNREGLELALQYFNEAIAADSNYALAYAGLADAYSFLPWYAGVRPRDASPQAKEMALRALSLDSSLAEGHAAHALVQWNYELDWAGAERSFRRALELNPQYAVARVWHGMYLLTTGRRDDGFAEIQRGIYIDPVSYNAHVNLAQALTVVGRYEEAIDEYRKAGAMRGQEYSNALADLYLKLGRVDEARMLIDEAGGPNISNAVGLGDTSQALRSLDALRQRSEREYVPPAVLADAYAALGDFDQAFAWLERALEDRDPRIAWLFERLLVWETVRRDPRFVGLLERMGLDKGGRPLER